MLAHKTLNGLWEEVPTVLSITSLVMQVAQPIEVVQDPPQLKMEMMEKRAQLLIHFKTTGQSNESTADDHGNNVDNATILTMNEPSVGVYH